MARRIVDESISISYLTAIEYSVDLLSPYVATARTLAYTNASIPPGVVYVTSSVNGRFLTDGIPCFSTEALAVMMGGGTTLRSKCRKLWL